MVAGALSATRPSKDKGSIPWLLLTGTSDAQPGLCQREQHPACGHPRRRNRPHGLRPGDLWRDAESALYGDL